MTVQLAALCMAAITAALWLEQRSWDRRHPKLPADLSDQSPSPLGRSSSGSAGTILRCLVCVGAPVVDDIATHSRLAHGRRVRGAEDHEAWTR